MNNKLTDTGVVRGFILMILQIFFQFIVIFGIGNIKKRLAHEINLQLKEQTIIISIIIIYTYEYYSNMVICKL